MTSDDAALDASATHLGRLTDAEAAVVEHAIEAVLTRYGVLPGVMGEYSILGAFQLEYEKARVFAAAGSGETRAPHAPLDIRDVRGTVMNGD